MPTHTLVERLKKLKPTMVPPLKGGKPKRITSPNAPGGNQTPGAKKKRKKKRG